MREREIEEEEREGGREKRGEGWIEAKTDRQT